MNEWMDEWNCVSCLLLRVCVISSVYLCQVLLCVCECVSVCVSMFWAFLLFVLSI